MISNLKEKYNVYSKTIKVLSNIVENIAFFDSRFNPASMFEELDTCLNEIAFIEGGEV